MRILHCADLHLDSALNTHLPQRQAQMRRNELLLQFVSMVEYAAAHGVRLVLIAGDLSDSPQISQKTGHVIVETIRKYPKIEFLYLTGNHDESALPYGEQKPDNLKLFRGAGGSYRYGEVVITGLLKHEYATRLKLKSEDTNIVMMHGQVMESGKADAQMINLSELSDRNIDYLALGHIHSYRLDTLDRRGNYCYSGCLEPRGFDETGEKGFVLLDVNTEEPVGHKVVPVFVPFAKRHAHLCEVDVNGIHNTPQISERIENELRNVSSHDMVKVTLTGELDAEVQINIDYLKQKFEREYFAFQIKDSTTIQLNYNAISKEDSLKGTFLRLVMQDEAVDEDEKKEIIRLGIRALAGEEIGE